MEMHPLRKEINQAIVLQHVINICSIIIMFVLVFISGQFEKATSVAAIAVIIFSVAFAGMSHFRIHQLGDFLEKEGTEDDKKWESFKRNHHKTKLVGLCGGLQFSPHLVVLTIALYNIFK
jgi:uncharacterized membrane protein